MFKLKKQAGGCRLYLPIGAPMPLLRHKLTESKGSQSSEIGLPVWIDKWNGGEKGIMWVKERQREVYLRSHFPDPRAITVHGKAKTVNIFWYFDNLFLRLDHASNGIFKANQLGGRKVNIFTCTYPISLSVSLFDHQLRSLTDKGKHSREKGNSTED